MNAVVFDTHAFVKRLTAVGMPEAQAEVLAQEQARLIDERLSTKSDVREVEQRLSAEIRALEQRIAGNLRELEQKLTANLREVEQRIDGNLRELELKLSADLQASEQRSAVNLRDLEIRLVTKMEAMRADTLRWTLGAIGLQTLAMLGAAIAIARSLH